VRQIELFAGKAASDLELRRLYDRLELQARTDALTGLLNRRSLLERLEEELAKARRFGTPLSLITIDVDDFKAFNDRFGHPDGDELLRVLADVLRRATRQHVDLVARYGGEEFVVVLPSTPAGGAEALAGRVRGNLGSEERSGMAIADMIRQTMAEHSSTTRSEKAGLRVTLSVGVVPRPRILRRRTDHQLRYGDVRG
jgi:diguanylate cyclase (GGDEF)-like protein